jgi:phosphomannomutase / phosphoglucomutase
MNNTINPEIFRAYDIRGIVDETITADDAYLIGRAYAAMLHDVGETEVLTACDVRLSTEAFLAQLHRGLIDSGIVVTHLGQIPTPVLYFAVNVLSIKNAMMLTASHNPANYNGMKMMIQTDVLSPEAIQGLYKRIIEKDFVSGEGSCQSDEVQGRYIETVIDQIHLARPLKCVIDCGNGIAGVLAPRLFKALGAEVASLYEKPDGRFPNHPADPSEPENLQDLQDRVVLEKADLGLAFDGDGDRVFMVDEKGCLVTSDHAIMLLAQAILATSPGAMVIHDVKCSREIAKVVRDLGGEVEMGQTGHSFMKRQMKSSGALLGGEASGHIFIKDRWFGFDDGSYVGARLMEIIAKQSLPVSALVNSLPQSVITPEYKIPVKESAKFALMARMIDEADFPDAVRITVDGLRIEYPDGWGLIRVSNTSPNLVCRFEAENEQRLSEIKLQFRLQLLSLDNCLMIPF